jgi:hypothetical protein
MPLYRRQVIKPTADLDAVAYIGKVAITDVTAQNQINDFVLGIKNLGLYNNMVAWPLRSTQNKGSGIIAYSLGGFGVYDGTLTNGPTWGTSGITFDGTNDFISTTLTTGFSEFSVFSIATQGPTASTWEFTKSATSVNRDFRLFQQSGALRFSVTNSGGFATVIGPTFTAGVIRAFIARASSSVNKIRKDNGSDTTGAVGTLTQSSQAVRIGGLGDAVTGTFDGTIHATIVFNTALSDADTSSVYNLYKNTLGQGLGLP